MAALSSTEVGQLKTETLVVPGEETISKVVGKLVELERYEAFVDYQGRIRVTSFRDMLEAADLQQKVCTIVSPIPLLDPKTNLRDASNLMMNHRVRALPISSGGAIVGEITNLSIMRSLRGAIPFNANVNRIMTAQPIALDAKDPTSKARKLMIRYQIDHLPVLDNTRLKGVVTSFDIISRMVPRESRRKGELLPEYVKRFNYPVKSLITGDPLTFPPDTALSKVLEAMLSKRVDHAVIAIGDEVQGIVCYRDFLKLLVSSVEAPIPVYMVGLPEDPFEAEAAKNKFMNSIKTLMRSHPDVIEARAKIKFSPKSLKKERRRYEVNVIIKTQGGIRAFQGSGWDLPDIFDSVSLRVKRILAQKYSKRKRRE